MNLLQEQANGLTGAHIAFALARCCTHDEYLACRRHRHGSASATARLPCQSLIDGTMQPKLTPSTNRVPHHGCTPNLVATARSALRLVQPAGTRPLGFRHIPGALPLPPPPEPHRDLSARRSSQNPAFRDQGPPA